MLLIEWRTSGNFAKSELGQNFALMLQEWGLVPSSFAELDLEDQTFIEEAYYNGIGNRIERYNYQNQGR